MSEYTPTTETVRERYWLATVNDPNFPGAEGYANDKRAEFDRWLAQHDAELRAEIERLRREVAAGIETERGSNATARRLLVEVKREVAQEALREAGQWLAATGYPSDWRTDVRVPDALWEAIVDVVHEGDDGRGLTREEVADWLAEEAGRTARGEPEGLGAVVRTSEGIEVLSEGNEEEA